MSTLAVGNRLRELRKLNNFTLKDVAKHLGLTSAALSCYETGTRKPPHQVIKRLSVIYQTSADYILTGDTEQTTNLNHVIDSKNLHWEGITLQDEEKELIKSFLTYLVKQKVIKSNF